MTAALIVAMQGNQAMTKTLGRAIGADIAEIELHAFPDGETYLRFASDLSGLALVTVCTLDRPIRRYCRCYSQQRQRANSERKRSAWWHLISRLCGRTGNSSRERP